MTSLMRDQIFISYSHKDERWLDAFLTMLAPAQARGLVQVWSDKEIVPGTDWHVQIRAALARARVGVLLVTPEFLKSKFIQEEELRSILSDAKSGELLLYWIPISASLFEYTDLKDIQAASDTARTLDTLERSERQRAIKEICRRLLGELGQLPAMTRASRVSLREQVAMEIGAKYELLEEVGTGSSSIVYRARRKSTRDIVAVKTLVTSAIQPNVAERWRESLRIAVTLESPAYIRIFDDFLDGDTTCIVSEFINGCRLDQYMSTTLVSPRNIRAILFDLARAMSEAHEATRLHGGLTPSNVHIDASHRPRISAFRFLRLVADSEPSGIILASQEACTYMSPEQFEGQPQTQLTDQYSLGVLGFELLSGLRLETITRPADFLKRPAIFADLAKQGPWAERSPEIAGIVSRMLRVDPEQRWSTMREVVALLGQLRIEDSSADERRRTTLSSYVRLQIGIDDDRHFYDTFYRHLFELLPHVKTHFAVVNMERQYQLLNRAIKLLIDYDPLSPETGKELESVARSHRRFSLSAHDLDAFRQSLLATLQEAGESNTAVLEAWMQVVTPGLDQLWRLMQGADTTQ